MTVRRIDHGQGATWPELTDEQRARVEDNLGLVGWVLGRRRTPDDEWDDAFQDGVFGLIRAAQMFDSAKGFRFSTYAYLWIVRAVGRGRAELLGVSYRTAREQGREWEHPSGLDAVLVDRAPGVERRAVASVLLEQAQALADTWDLDRLDRAIVDELLATGATRPRGADVRVAKRCGVSTEAVRRRRLALHSRFRSWSEAA